MNKKAMEMTINAVVVLVIALILIAVGVYLIYSKILKPSEATSSFTSCQGMKGTPVDSCVACQSSEGQCYKLIDEQTKQFVSCCIKQL